MNQQNASISIQLRSFESQIAYMNGMYQLPLAAYPSVGAQAKWQQVHGTHVVQISQENGQNLSVPKLLADRVGQFASVLEKEINEGGDIINQLLSGKKEDGSVYDPIDYLTEMADWCGDIIVYAASEMARLGIPIMEVLRIIMSSNFSKLDENGQPIIKDGKFQKGPFYWKPEPKIKELLQQLIAEYNQTPMQAASSLKAENGTAPE